MGLWKTLVICLGVVSLVSVIRLCEAREFNVGGDNKTSWQIPSPSDSFDKWAQRNRFLIGDSIGINSFSSSTKPYIYILWNLINIYIVFKYDGKTDSVVEVSEADYKSCSKSNPIKSHNDGNTKLTFEKSGVFYFISGAEAHCHKAQKLEVRILAANHHHHHLSPAPAPAPHKAAAATPPLPLGFIGALASLPFITALVY